MRLWAWGVVALVGLAVGSAASSAPTTFPGRNGLIAFVREESPCGMAGGGFACPTALWVQSVDGSYAKRLTPIRGKTDTRFYPTWSPDGTKIAYIDNSGNKQRSFEVWVVNADGSGRRKVVKAGAYGFDLNIQTLLSWTADGREIVFGTSSSVRAVQIKGGRSRDLFKFPSQGWYRFQLSPDGSHIAFSTREGLVVSRSNGTGKRNLKVILWNGVPSWSPDGRKIVIADLATGDTGDRNAHDSLRIIDVGSGSSREILFAEMDKGWGSKPCSRPTAS